MRVKFYGLTKSATDKLENVLTHEQISHVIEYDDFDGLCNVEVSNFENWILTVSLQYIGV